MSRTGDSLIDDLRVAIDAYCDASGGDDSAKYKIFSAARQLDRSGIADVTSGFIKLRQRALHIRFISRADALADPRRFL